MVFIALILLPDKLAPVRICVSPRDGEQTRIDMDLLSAFFAKFPEMRDLDVPALLDTEMAKVFEEAAAYPRRRQPSRGDSSKSGSSPYVKRSPPPPDPLRVLWSGAAVQTSRGAAVRWVWRVPVNECTRFRVGLVFSGFS